MSAQGTLPPARAASAGPATLLIALALVAIAAAASSCRGGAEPYVLLSATAPDTHHVAVVRLARCEAAWCESLWLGVTPDNARMIATLPPGRERCSEIAWSRDGRRVGFLINGYQLRLYHAESGAPAGLVDLVPRDSDPTTRLARGLTFSSNGAAITFDDCPRDRSGCKPGLVAMR